MANQSITISKRTLVIIITAAVVFVGVTIAIALTLIENKQPTSINPDIDPNASAWTGEQPEDRGGATQVGIKIPGYPSITIPKDQKEINVALLNPAGNPCYFKFEICLKETNEVLYTSKLVPPGQAITKIEMSRPLSAGEYATVIRISTVSLTDNSAMNGANVETVLIAQ